MSANTFTGNFLYPYKHQFLLNPEFLENGQVHYALDMDRERWPWSKLPASHPVWIGKYSFFIGITCGLDILKLSPKSASALTKVSWKNLPACFEDRQASSTLAEIAQEGDKIYYACEVMNPENMLMQSMQAWGVIFQRRDYGSWRDKIKNAIERIRPQDFSFAAHETAGVDSASECFVSALHESRQGLACYALIDKQSGFIPRHPWHTGTGDHVNAGQLLDAAFQAAHLVGDAQGWWKRGQALTCLGGEAGFRKYVELGAPFEIRLSGWKPLDGARSLRFKLLQNNKTCTEIMLQVR